MRCGIWVSPHIVSFWARSSHTALHARGSMAKGITRWFTSLASMTTAAFAKAASTSPFSIFMLTPRFDPVSG